jgi:hypothetical protein
MGTDLSEDLGADGRLIIRGISEKLGMRVWTWFIWLRIGGQLWVLINMVLNL